ncbi:MAG TPA: serine/threonine-protein kinase [Tepidisphaeraceae bacterium]|jgi:uncharacterized membrane protein
MWNFQYKHGDRPLEGYTIQRGAGRGGFGEVYYAISDSGREVALKAVQGYEQIELRGISQCMNLKNPHLVTIFDVRYNDAGRPFVIMEFVSGPSLRQLLDESPAGLGTQKAAFFLREMGKGLTYLHDNGIVHRDLKPANVFFENGYVKIGDYGLSKAIESTAHTTQTVTVGTVHYMAPEVGAGKYDRSIDIYAMGAVLYEMITGMVPFSGASPSEVLLKHLSTEPDCTGIAEPFASVIKKAMAKDPRQRYTSIQEMVEAVFGEEHVRQSVSVFSPDQLSVIAGHAAMKVGGTPAPRGGAAVATGSGSEHLQAHKSDVFGRAGAWVDQVADRLAGGRITGSAATSPSSHTYAVAPTVQDPMTRHQRKLLSFMILLGIGIAAAAVSAGSFKTVLLVMLATMGAAVGLRSAARKLMPQLENETPFLQRLAMGATATGMMILFCFPFMFMQAGVVSHGSQQRMVGDWLGIIAPLFFMNTLAWIRASRTDRVSFWDTAFLAGLFSAIAAPIFGGDPFFPAIVSCGICLVTQVLSPWDPNARPTDPQAPVKQRIHDAFKSTFDEVFHKAPPAQPATAPSTAPIMPPPVPMSVRPARLVPQAVRATFLVTSIISFGLAVAFFVAAGMGRLNDFGFFLGLGLGFSWLWLLTFIQTFRTRRYSHWSYAGRPLVFLLCGVSIIIAVTFLSTENHIAAEEMAVSVFFIVVPSIGMILSSFLRFAPVAAAGAPSAEGAPLTDQQRQVQTQSGSGQSQTQAQSASTAPVPLGFPYTGATRSERRAYRHEQRRLWREARHHHRELRRRTGSILSFPAFVAMMIATLLVAAVSIDVPRAIAAGIPDQSLRRSFAATFSDYPEWPMLLTRLGTFAAAIFAFVAVGLAILARRQAGAYHILRGVLGSLLMLLAAILLNPAFRSFPWDEIGHLLGRNRSTAALAAAIDGISAPPLVMALCVLLLSATLLAWPRPAPEKPITEGAAS